MTSTQNQAIWELCRQGLHDAAQRAEGAWSHGQCFLLEGSSAVTRTIAHLVAAGNWEVQAGTAVGVYGDIERPKGAYRRAA